MAGHGNAAAQVNDNCTNSAVVAISSSGFGMGTFTSATVNMTTATVQPGETFAPALFAAGQSQKSVWYRFSLPTPRSVRLTLLQPGTEIAAGDVGFAVYKSSNCLPGNAQISTQLTPIGVFGNSFHPCLDPGDYLVQVSGKAGANGSVYVQLAVDKPVAAYDDPATAYDFGTLPVGTRMVEYDVDCQSIRDSLERCTAMLNARRYNKSSWHVFTTPGYFDYVNLWLGFQNLDNQKVGYRILQGDARTQNIDNMPVVVDCDSLEPVTGTDWWRPRYLARRTLACGRLLPSRTYSLQLLFDQDTKDRVRLALSLNGTGPTRAPRPIRSALPASNDLGVLATSPTGVPRTVTDFMACNGRLSQNACGPALPANGILWNGYRYNISTFFRFTLSATTNLSLNANFAPCGQPLPYMRLFSGDMTDNCADLTPSRVAGQWYGSGAVNCLPPGQYVLQILGVDTVMSDRRTYDQIASNSSWPFCEAMNLGSTLNLTLTAQTVQASNLFSLRTPGAIEHINGTATALQPLVPGVIYNNRTDTIGCERTVRPPDSCGPGQNKVIFRRFQVSDSGILQVALNYQNTYAFNTKLYAGDASLLAAAQGTTGFPQRINGLIPISSDCIDARNGGGIGECGRSPRYCLTPGVYTLATFAEDGWVGVPSTASEQFLTLQTKFHSPATAENIGDIIARGRNVLTEKDNFGCRSNLVAIPGYQPRADGSRPANKAIYRQFYLSEPSLVSISPVDCNYSWTLMAGKISDGVHTLSLLAPKWHYPESYNNVIPNNECDILPAGWYTIISYHTSPAYGEPDNSSRHRLANSNQFRIQASPARICAKPKYNRPHRAAVDPATNQPFLIEWGPNPGHTAAYPSTARTYTLPVENLDCSQDTPFVRHPIPACGSELTKVVYYVFRLTQVSYVEIQRPYGNAVIYPFDVRSDSARMLTTTPLQPCTNYLTTSPLKICRMQPGLYTLVLYLRSSEICASVQPVIYIDDHGTVSRFDHARNAYDFGLIPNDSTFRNGKVGDVNPLHPDRAPSHDFFYCTTGSQGTDPITSVYSSYCASNLKLEPRIYDPKTNNDLTGTYARRNLWYTFQVKGEGKVTVRVRSIGKPYKMMFMVYRSDVDGNLSFSSVVSSGQVDSTESQGLTWVAEPGKLSWNGYDLCIASSDEVSFNVFTCDPTPKRYYVVVYLPDKGRYDPEYIMAPNGQVEVSVLSATRDPQTTRFDHYAKASNIGSSLGAGDHVGERDFYNCATATVTDPKNPIFTSCIEKRNIWYAFSTRVTGTIQLLEPSMPGIDHAVFPRLYRVIRQGDSTSAGLQEVPTSRLGVGSEIWHTGCISPGTYYILYGDCSNAPLNNPITIQPRIRITEQVGDFCSAPVDARLPGPGSVVSSAQVDCHTIGTDYGEFNPTLSCPQGVDRTRYKTTWFRIRIDGRDTLDVTTFINENTSAASSEIKYRLMNGSCGAMQERSCVQDALTRDTYKCLAPGSYFVQVFTPVAATGTISLNLSAVKHQDTCAPSPPCLATAAFIPRFDCNTTDSVSFENLSTYGSDITYRWDFGHGGATSTAVSPFYRYPALATSQTYTVKLVVTNTACNRSDSSTVTVTIPGRPAVDLGPDRVECTPGTYTLNATSWPGATYRWQNGSTSPTFSTSASTGTYTVAVTFNGCTRRDTLNLSINPILPRSQSLVICDNGSATLNSARFQGESHLWSTGAQTGSINVNTPGLYMNRMDWRGCSVVDTFRVLSPPSPFGGRDTVICHPMRPVTLNATVTGAIGYSWVGGGTGAQRSVSVPGIYRVDINFGNCSRRDSIRVLVTAAPVDSIRSVNVCSGQSFTLPWGAVVTASGIYRDTLRYRTGCDSIRRTVNLTVLPLVRQSLQGGFCTGFGYTLPTGRVVTTPGVYIDTLRYRASGCDSLIRTVTVSEAAVREEQRSDTVCAGASFVLPWGRMVTAAGTYRDTLRYVQGGCDSVRRTVNLTLQSVQTRTTDTVICTGQSYTLPRGTVVTASGTYRDTLRYTTGCDSIRRTVNLTVLPVLRQSLQGGFCAGSGYTLPNGRVVTAAGVYIDTLRYVQSGCDSLIRTVTVALSTFTDVLRSDTICQGGSHVLPWGRTVTAAGTYRDTLRYAQGGCDSVRRTVHLTVQTAQTRATDTVICIGQSYTLPWGALVTASGTYRDTLRYTTGCDSVRRVVNLRVQTFAVLEQQATFCAGATYRLPWGRTVTEPGVYRDTLRYTTGCDSVRRAVTLTRQEVSTQERFDTVCAGTGFVLPWGRTVMVAGTYRDTLRYTTGCDSVRRTVQLTVQTAETRTMDTVICIGQSYTLPWGVVVTAAGTYRDTLRYTRGCDSVRRVVNLRVQTFAEQELQATFCAGATYRLPWGRTVTEPGVYRDTLRYTTGCDSVRRTVTLVRQEVQTRTLFDTTCIGRSYPLPWGGTATTTGRYRDTLRYRTGCDSVIRILDLTVQAFVEDSRNVTICSGGSYALPWGPIVRASGTYRDTLRYRTGCDSLRRSIVLTVTPPAVAAVQQASICADEVFRLPWGLTVNRAGIYRDTLRTASGCDSLIRTVRLEVRPLPTVRADWSNDINCVLSVTRLQATGALTYRWRPGGTLSDSTASNPVARPQATTRYVVEGTGANGCRSRDSVVVSVNFTDDPNKYLVPSAFTPNVDGLNDCFGVRHWGDVTGFRLQVFNRYGSMVYETEDPKKCWDGRYRGILQPTGVYVYFIRAEGPCGEVLRKGTVTLIR